MIQELVEVIVDFLYDSQTDLRRCCLVGKAWLPVARFHLFAYFALASGGECRRLAHMQDYAPHLLDLITHLAIGLSSQDVDASWAYSFLEKITFTRLRRLSILTLPPADSLPVLQNIIAQPQVSHVTVKPTDDNRLMFSLFRYRTAGLKTLEVRSRHYEEAMGMGMGAPPLANRFPVECLRLETISKKLDDPAVSPFDMQDLKHLEICDYIASESFEGILQQLGSLSSLDIATYFNGRSDSRSFGQVAFRLPRLTDLSISLDNPSMLAGLPTFLMSILEHAPLKRLSLAVSRDCAPDGDSIPHFPLRTDWDRIDETIYRSRTPIVLTVTVSLMTGGALTSKHGVWEMRECFPRLLGARRVLIVASLRNDARDASIPFNLYAAQY